MIVYNGKKLCSNCFAEMTEKQTVCPVCGYEDEDSERFPIALPMGTVLLGKYVIGKLLGKGGFGITYLAFDMKEGKTVAVKEYLPDSLIHRNTGETLVSTFYGDKEEAFKTGAEKFYEEAKTIARFNGHPNIIHVSEFFYENNTAYFVMEYIKGVDLKAYIAKKGGSLSEQETLKILAPLLDALTSVHAVGVLHRDISPDNIFVTDDGTVKLLDFGSARQVLGEQSKSLSVILKPGFAPIEQYQTHGKQGEWTDIYALAATMYYCLTGKVPEASMDRIEQDGLPKPSKLGIAVSQKLETVLMKALSVRAISRYQTVEEMKKALGALISVPKTEKKVEAVWEYQHSVRGVVHRVKPLLKNRKAVIAIIAVCAVMIGLAGYGTWNAVNQKGLTTGGKAVNVYSAAGDKSQTGRQDGSAGSTKGTNTTNLTNPSESSAKSSGSPNSRVTGTGVTPEATSKNSTSSVISSSASNLTVPLSSDCSLKSLSIADNPYCFDNCGLSPSFVPDITEYDTTVMDFVYSPTIKINAVAKNSGAKVTITGSGIDKGTLASGEYNLIAITVKAPSGATRTYKVNMFYSTNEYNNYIGNLKATDKVFVENIKFNNTYDAIMTVRIYNRENYAINVTDLSFSVFTDYKKDTYFAQKSYTLNTLVPVGQYKELTLTIPSSEIANKQTMLLMAMIDTSIKYHD